MFNVGVTLGSSHNMINAGVTHKFGVAVIEKMLFQNVIKLVLSALSTYAR